MISSSKHTQYAQKYTSTKKGHITRYLVRAKKRAQLKNLPFDLDLEYLRLIAPDKCPVFGTEFIWGRMQGAQHRYTPSLDRIIPELGYVKGNVVFISLWANMIKADATEKELYAVADWLHDARKKVLNANKKSTTPISNGINQESSPDTKHGSISSTGIGQNSDDTNDYRGAVSGYNAYRSTKEGS